MATRHEALTIADQLDKLAEEAPDVHISDLDRAASSVVAWEAIKDAASYAPTDVTKPTNPAKGPPTAKPSEINKAMPSPASSGGSSSKTAEEKVAFGFLAGLGALTAGAGVLGGAYAARQGARKMISRLGKGYADEAAEAAIKKVQKAEAGLSMDQLAKLRGGAEDASKAWTPTQTALAAGGGTLVGSELLRNRNKDGIKVQKVAEAAGFADTIAEKTAFLGIGRFGRWLGGKALGRGALSAERAAGHASGLATGRSQGARVAVKAKAQGRKASIGDMSIKEMGEEAWKRYRGLSLPVQVGVPAAALYAGHRMGSREQTVQKF